MQQFVRLIYVNTIKLFNIAIIASFLIGINTLHPQADILCLSKNKKNVFTSKTAKSCRQLKGRVLNLNGLKGNAGAQGEKGPQGPQGNQGNSGPSGVIKMTYLSDEDEHSITPNQTLNFQLLMGFGSTFTKVSDDSDLLITLIGNGTTTANSGGASTRACVFQMRLNDLSSQGSSSLALDDTLGHSGNQVIRALLANSESQQSTLSITGLFKSQFFPAGTYTPRIYVRSNIADTINCSVNSGIYNTQIIIQEILPQDS